MHTNAYRVVPLDSTGDFGWALRQACDGIERLPNRQPPSLNRDGPSDGVYTVYALYLRFNGLKVGHSGNIHNRLSNHEDAGLEWADEENDWAAFEDAREAWAVEGLLQRILPATTGRNLYHFDVHADEYAKAAAPRLYAELEAPREARRWR